jgi:adenosylcobinamide-GDP ribazoletransferase
MLGRWGIAAAIVFFPYARHQGLGRDMKDHADRSQAILATVIVLVVSWLTARWLGWLSFVLAGLALITWIRFVLAHLPGLTGDTYGAACELLELLVLLIFAISFRG